MTQLSTTAERYSSDLNDHEWQVLAILFTQTLCHLIHFTAAIHIVGLRRDVVSFSRA